MNTIQNLKNELLQQLNDVMDNTQPTKNLSKGVEIAVYPLSDDALTSNETITIYNYDQLQALQDLVSLQGEYDVEVQYLDSEYHLWGEALYNITYFVKLATRFPEIPVEVINWVIDNFGDAEDVEEILNDIKENDLNYMIVEATDELQAFYEWIDVYEELDISSDLQAYFNYEKYMTDRVEHGTLNIQQLAFNKYLVIDTKNY